eukprot:m.175575 g.175575  ORF g.175575 m.175575 type:complete len:422 (-) comp18361_c0_seq2:20-1285(-)
MLRDVRPSPAELEIVGNVSCSICGKRLRNSGVLNVHLRTHGAALPKTSTVKNVRYFCPVKSCSRFSKPYTRLAQLKEHYGSCHAPKLFKCSRCGKAFGMISAGRRHEATCGVKYKCDCGKLFESVDSRNKHAKKAGHSYSSMTSSSSLHPPKSMEGRKKRVPKRKRSAYDGPSDQHKSQTFAGNAVRGCKSAVQSSVQRMLPATTRIKACSSEKGVENTVESSLGSSKPQFDATTENIATSPASGMVHCAAQTSMVGDELESATSLIALTYAAETIKPQVTFTATASQTVICLNTDIVVSAACDEVYTMSPQHRGCNPTTTTVDSGTCHARHPGRTTELFSPLEESTPSPPKVAAAMRTPHKATPVEGSAQTDFSFSSPLAMDAASYYDPAVCSAESATQTDLLSHFMQSDSEVSHLFPNL